MSARAGSSSHNSSKLREALAGSTSKDKGPLVADGVLSVTPEVGAGTTSPLEQLAASSDFLDDEGKRPNGLFGAYTWRIEGFSEIGKRELRSNQFDVGEYKWYILVYPQGCDVCNHLSLFLCVADYDKLLPGWSHFAQFTIAVVNKDPKKSKYSDTLHRFCKKEHDWGWKKFMELSKVLDGFTVQDTLVIKAQVQVILDRPSRPFRCLDAQYRRELVRVYLTNVESICRRFCEDKRTRLAWLREEAPTFRGWWRGLSSEQRRQLTTEKGDAILKGIVKAFFNEKEVTSSLVMDALFAGCKQLEALGRSKDALPTCSAAPCVVINGRAGTFSFALDALDVVAQLAADFIPTSRDDKPLPLGADGLALRSVCDELSELRRDALERDEKRLAELGQRTVEMFALAHICTESLERAYRDYQAEKRMKDLIAEEEEAGRLEDERAAARAAADKERRAKKKERKKAKKEAEKAKRDAEEAERAREEEARRAEADKRSAEAAERRRQEEAALALAAQQAAAAQKQRAADKARKQAAQAAQQAAAQEQAALANGHGPSSSSSSSSSHGHDVQAGGKGAAAGAASSSNGGELPPAAAGSRNRGSGGPGSWIRVGGAVAGSTAESGSDAASTSSSGDGCSETSSMDSSRGCAPVGRPHAAPAAGSIRGPAPPQQQQQQQHGRGTGPPPPHPHPPHHSGQHATGSGPPLPGHAHSSAAAAAASSGPSSTGSGVTPTGYAAAVAGMRPPPPAEATAAAAASAEQQRRLRELAAEVAELTSKVHSLEAALASRDAALSERDDELRRLRAQAGLQAQQVADLRSSLAAATAAAARGSSGDAGSSGSRGGRSRAGSLDLADAAVVGAGPSGRPAPWAAIAAGPGGAMRESSLSSASSQDAGAVAAAAAAAAGSGAPGSGAQAGASSSSAAPSYAQSVAGGMSHALHPAGSPGLAPGGPVGQRAAGAAGASSSGQGGPGRSGAAGSNGPLPDSELPGPSSRAPGGYSAAAASGVGAPSGPGRPGSSGAGSSGRGPPGRVGSGGLVNGDGLASGLSGLKGAAAVPGGPSGPSHGQAGFLANGMAGVLHSTAPLGLANGPGGAGSSGPQGQLPVGPPSYRNAAAGAGPGPGAGRQQQQQQPSQQPGDAGAGPGSAALGSLGPPAGMLMAHGQQQAKAGGGLGGKAGGGLGGGSHPFGAPFGSGNMGAAPGRGMGFGHMPPAAKGGEAGPGGPRGSASSIVEDAGLDGFVHMNMIDDLLTE